MRHPIVCSPGQVAALACLSLLAAASARAQVAAPGDIYYSVHLDQKSQFYVSAGDVRVWENSDTAGTSLAGSASHDTSETAGWHGLSCTYTADAGTFAADFDTHMYMQARTGLYHALTNQLTVSIYVRGPNGTPWWIRRADDGEAQAWRLGGLPGSLQDVNGTASAGFADSVAYTDSGGTVVKRDSTSTLSQGVTLGEILVGGETYSLAKTYVLKAPASMTQAVCILGCMTLAADFGTESAGRVELETFPYVSPVGVPPVAPATLMVRAAPNPLRSRSTISFRAPAGERSSVRVFDLGGRLVAELFDGVASGDVQSLAWQPPASGAALYFVQVRAAGRSATAKLARVE